MVLIYLLSIPGGLGKLRRRILLGAVSIIKEDLGAQEGEELHSACSPQPGLEPNTVKTLGCF